MLFNRIYYNMRPFIPRRVRVALRRIQISARLKSNKQEWPISHKAARQPKSWPGWPQQKRFAFILTHDVEAKKGYEKCNSLIELEEKLGFRSGLFFVPEGNYRIGPEMRRNLNARGFEVCIHGLRHDGKLYTSKKLFKKKAIWINRYLKEWNAVGFRSPFMDSDLEYLHELDIEYDCSTFDTDPFEPKPSGVEIIFPFWIPKGESNSGYMELPYTLPQDWTLFVLMREKSIEVWKKKMDWIVEQGGMVLVLTHPDYMRFDEKKPKFNEYPVGYYEEFLNYVKDKYEGQYWHVLPKDIARFWIKNQRNIIK
jgi:peptidoglycan/xylan/chitin deacetylase (PgdA/CDA1 family)